MAQRCDVSEPLVMKWTVLPARITAKAWVDPEFRDRLLADPDLIIRQMAPNVSKALAPQTRIHVHANTAGVRHYPLPYYRPEFDAFSPEALRAAVIDETGHDPALEWMLPAEVIFHALVDSGYRSRLVASPNETLREKGFEPEGIEVKVWENAPDACHLALPFNFWPDEALDYETLLDRCIERMLACS